MCKCVTVVCVIRSVVKRSAAFWLLTVITSPHLEACKDHIFAFNRSCNAWREISLFSPYSSQFFRARKPVTLPHANCPKHGCSCELFYPEQTLPVLWVQPGSFTDMRPLTTGIRSENCVVRRFRRCANVYTHKPR
jgi:hypothetical protein